MYNVFVFSLKYNKIENHFTKCCFDFEVVGFQSECDQSNYQENQDPAFAVFYQRASDNTVIVLIVNN